MTQVILRMRYRATAISPRFALGVSICVAGCVALLQSVASGLSSAWSLVGPDVAQALGASALAGVTTGLGALCVLTMKQDSKTRSTFAFLALSGGAMLSAAILSLLGPAVRMTTTPGAIDVFLAAVTGYAAMAALDRMLPHLHAAPCDCATRSAGSMRLMVIAIAVHNLPEGFAVGAGFGGGNDLGWGTAVSIGLQNVPEGLIVATALWSIGMRRTTALALAVATGLLEPFGAAVGIAAVGISALTLPIALAAAGGAMLFVVLQELIPESLKGASWRAVTVSVTAGSLGMAVLLTAA